MGNDVLGLEAREVRGIDSNSLLRLYDRAQGILNHSPLLQERAKAHRTIGRIAKELERRKVAL